MILALTVPRLGAQVHQAVIHKVLANGGVELRPGTPLFEVRVDFGAAKAQDCPPVLFFRIIATERAFLRQLNASVADVVEVGARLGIATSDAKESFEAAPARYLRTTSVAIQVDPLSRR